jgi:NYN domain-containing protein
VPTPEITVFIDYQNAHLRGHEKWCPEGEPAHHCLIDPLLVADRVVQRRAPGGVVTSVRAHRGRPDPRHEPASAARSDQQASAWGVDSRVQILRRPLAYPRDWGTARCVEKAREKGIDVSIAIDMVQMALRTEYEVGILFSRDTALVPAVQLVFDLPGVHTEVATWQGASRLRLPFRSLFCHKLTQADFVAVRDSRAY